MADDILKNSLTGTSSLSPTLPAVPQGLKVPDLTGNNQADIAKLSAAQKQPSLLVDFQKVMQMTSRQAYNERQTAEMEIAGKQFDPTKVSGGTFASIIGTMEANRGADISKVYSATMQAYSLAQEQITKRLEFLQELEENKRQFEAQMKLKKEELKLAKKENKDKYKLLKKQYELDREEFEAGYKISLQKLINSQNAENFWGNIDLIEAEYNANLVGGQTSTTQSTGLPSFEDFIYGK